MRDQRFVAEHRGGPLSMHDHRLLARWAADCAEHVLSDLWEDDNDPRPFDAIRQARAWARGEISVGEARKAAVAAHAAARESHDAAATAVARASGHAVATAHMADHSLGGALYALKALKIAGQSINAERKWQDEQLPSEIKELVLTTRQTRKFKDP